jgi:hypothetical protein
MGSIAKKKCQHCGKLFIPDARNAKRQQYCHLPACRKASKADSQRRWSQKPENQDHFRGPINCGRVRQWRAEHPGYWRRQKSGPDALQDPLTAKHPEINTDTFISATSALQDLLILQPDVIIGLIANFTGSALQDDIAISVRRLQQLGRDILNPQIKGAHDGYQGTDYYPKGAQSAQTVQLGRSTPGA